MTSSQDVVEYIFLEYASSLDFISNVLENVRSEEDLDHYLYYMAWSAIRSYGYKTDLTYRNLQKDFKKEFLKRGIFTITQDSLFGEKCEFNLDKYVSFISALKQKSAAYSRIEERRKVFGEEGLRRALTRTAVEHKWTEIGSQDAISDEGEAEAQPGSRIYLIPESDRQQIVTGLRELQRITETAELDQVAKAQALALVSAALCLAESPSPNWRMVREILYSVAAISTLLSLAIQIAELIH